MDIQLTETELDQLRELGNIGCGHAATALSKLMQRKVVMSIPNVQTVSQEQFLEVVVREPPETVVAHIRCDLRGDLKGLFNIIMPMADAAVILETIGGVSGKELNHLSKKESSLLIETGNIINGAFATVIADMLKLNIEVFSPPRMVIDMLGASMESVALEMLLETNIVFTIHTQVFPENLKGDKHLILMLKHKSARLLLDRLNKMLRKRP